MQPVDDDKLKQQEALDKFGQKAIKCLVNYVAELTENGLTDYEISIAIEVLYVKLISAISEIYGKDIATEMLSHSIKALSQMDTTKTGIH